MAADRNFGRHTRGFPAAERLEDIDCPTLFAKVAWHYVERGPAGERRSALLHRDMSTNRMLVVRSPFGGTRTGTLPFMSVLNLEANWFEHTELDDSESLLYLVCWLATFGINKEDRKLVRSGGKDLRGLGICRWRHGLMSSIPGNKRDH
ncbi:hypothetical protein GQ54DRAFT_300377, partial [Martensiomyces pterosporus]